MAQVLYWVSVLTVIFQIPVLLSLCIPNQNISLIPELGLSSRDPVKPVNASFDFFIAHLMYR